MFGFGSIPKMTNTTPVNPRKNREDLSDVLDFVGKQVIVNLRDGRTMIGKLRSLDVFGNLMLTGSFERIFVDKQYGDVPGGIVMVRGDNVVIVGEIEVSKKTNVLEEVPCEDILSAQREAIENLELREQNRIQGFKDQGLHYIPRLNYQDRVTIHLGEDLFTVQ